MNLTHEFFLISSDFEFNDRYEWYRTNRYKWEEQVELSDDIIQYMMDFLAWVPSYNPETKEYGNGLNYYGVTVIHKLGAEKPIRVFDKLLKLINEEEILFGEKRRMAKVTGSRRGIG